MRALILAAGLATALVGTSGRAQAEDLWGANIGVFDVLQDDGYRTGAIGLEWRGESFFWKVRPLVGGGANLDTAVWGYAGIAVDLGITDNIVITPSFAPTLYSKGDSKGLGSWFEFRSGIELAYRFEDESRIGIGIAHLSHAGLGGDENPGTEIVTLQYMLPLSYPFGQ